MKSYIPKEDRCRFMQVDPSDFVDAYEVDTGFYLGPEFCYKNAKHNDEHIFYCGNICPCKNFEHRKKRAETTSANKAR